MRSIPVDTSRLTTLVGGAIEPATNQDGSQKRNRSGQPMFSVPVVVVIEGGNADTMTVRVPGPVTQIAPLTALRV